MYTVYCYAYYFTIKGTTNVGNSGLCVTIRDGISRTITPKNVCWLFFFLLIYWNISLYQECLFQIKPTFSYKKNAGKEIIESSFKNFSNIPFMISRDNLKK